MRIHHLWRMCVVVCCYDFVCWFLVFKSTVLDMVTRLNLREGSIINRNIQTSTVQRVIKGGIVYTK